MTLPSKISVQNPKPFTKEQIIELENLTGLIFTDELVSFFTKFAGGKPKIRGKDCFTKIVHQEGWKTSNRIVKIESFDSVRDTWKYNGYLKEFKKHFIIPDSVVEIEHRLPIMELMADSIRYVSGGLHSEKMYYVDNGDFGIVKIADSLDDFLKNLYTE